MITGTLVIADMAISFTLPDVVTKPGTVTVCEMGTGNTYTTECTHAELAASLMLALAGDDAVSEDIADNLYELAGPIQPDHLGPWEACRWIP
jgi:hypothetical protein